VISNSGEQVGIIDYKKAQSMASEDGLDLVLVSDNGDVPVVRIMDYGKLRFEQKKKIKDQKKASHKTKLKEVKFRVNIEKHDYDYKINHAIDFLGKGNKVKLTLMFRGREMAHKEIGFELIQRVLVDLEEHGKVESPAKLMGRNITAVLTPIGKK
jgi:translation initiation factor IF-3